MQNWIFFVSLSYINYWFPWSKGWVSWKSHLSVGDTLIWNPWLYHSIIHEFFIFHRDGIFSITNRKVFKDKPIVLALNQELYLKTKLPDFCCFLPHMFIFLKRSGFVVPCFVSKLIELIFFILQIILLSLEYFRFHDMSVYPSLQDLPKVVLSNQRT